ncbi:Piso0_002344 [Millerozyma farinosa CBS 7064]|uniref:Peptidase M20 domain-containing protein 2 n=1 Tax=Pichia sorbitophila (strain ATCC MYA-4447 / BCRC 22081 / CBS 7064 / NBRC 10061 / NRRL Y-12695) TaxID=559304 RepID=G8YCD1_PICSO|nr:Piso0_002344 [Millerozyma farinosa CBS 7064]
MPSKEEIQSTIAQAMEESKDDIIKVAKELYEHPELAFEEHHAHDFITGYFQSLGEFKVTRHAYGLDTAFEVLYENGGRLVNFNAEMDALPDIGHGCGHNLIAACGCASFLALVKILKKYNIPGSVQLLGTPAEESMGGKCKLVENGAYKGVSASFMAHPLVIENEGDLIQLSSNSLLACSMIECEYTGAPAHASAFPWDGINAFDACIGSWVNISMLRQQIRPYQRIHGYFKDVPTVSNVIPAKSTAVYQFRSRLRNEVDELKKKVENCCIAGATATGCSYKLKEVFSYSDMINVPSLVDACYETAQDMCGDEYLLQKEDEGHPDASGSSDIGNVSYEVPAIHIVYKIPTLEKCPQHSAGFAKSAGNLETSIPPTLASAKVLAASAYKVLTDDKLLETVQNEHSKLI